MKTVALGVVATLAILLFTPCQAETRFDRAEQHLAAIIHSRYYPIILGQLQSLQLSRSTQESKAIDLINGYADCVMSALKGNGTLETSELLNVLAERYTPQNIARYFSFLSDTDAEELFGILEKPIRTCAMRVEREIGLARDAKDEFFIYPSGIGKSGH